MLHGTGDSAASQIPVPLSSVSSSKEDGYQISWVDDPLPAQQRWQNHRWRFESYCQVTEGHWRLSWVGELSPCRAARSKEQNRRHGQRTHGACVSRIWVRFYVEGSRNNNFEIIIVADRYIVLAVCQAVFWALYPFNPHSKPAAEYLNMTLKG